MLSFKLYVINLLLLLLLTGQLLTDPALSTSKIDFINNIIAKVQNERPVETLLFMKRRTDINCPLQEISPVGLATLRLDERTVVNVKQLFNSEALALVCMSELADSQLLTTVAQNLDRMREARIVILSQVRPSNLEEFLRIVSEQANEYSLVNLIVLHSTLYNFEGSISAYRLQPFPSPIFESVLDINDGPIFPKVWLNFRGKTAVILPDLSPPRSMLITNPRTGEQKLGGSSDRFIMEFAQKNNINLQWHHNLSDIGGMDISDVFNITKEGHIDLPIRPFVQTLWPPTANMEYANVISFLNVFVIVPCGKEMRIGDVYVGLKTYSTIVLGSYFMLAIIETLFVCATNQIFRRRPLLTYSTLVLNLRALAGVMGLPIPFRRHRTSFSLHQIIMVMGVFSLVLSSYFNANLSTLLTKHPQLKQIQNFEELRRSGLSVLFDRSFKVVLKKEIGKINFDKLLPNVEYLPTKQYENKILTLNTSYAYHMHTNIWEVLDRYQKSHNRIVLCKSHELKLLGDAPHNNILKKNSVYREAFLDFVHNTNRFGLRNYWEFTAGQNMMSNVHSRLANTSPEVNQEFKPMPLNFEDFKWLWKLLGICYGVAGLVFIGEICIGHWQKKRADRGAFIPTQYIP
ncbi:uncharacterized protein Dvir_GJ23148 [Drosophila virilis]|uniref:Ionotropic glutamate receptor C-terminal domain-containing protein n=1 Tax=Drosophila virilis TaxID=7244 RepID=B4M0M3_DROVI|nr:uncharacterized protein Dvir_GJ23148 [Drosophila virilis]